MSIPITEYRRRYCRECDDLFEVLVEVHTGLGTCPNCGGSELE